MAILFEWYENPVAPNQSQEETKLHARITLNGKTGTDRLRRKIQERCSLTETDVSPCSTPCLMQWVKNWRKAGRYIWMVSVTSTLP